MTEIRRDVHFDAAHRLPNVRPGHKCARLHGHTWQLAIIVRGEVNEITGWIIDYYEIDAAWLPIHDQIDHRYLNEVEGLENPTTELMVRWIWERLDLALPGLHRLELQEGLRSACCYEGR